MIRKIADAQPTPSLGSFTYESSLTEQQKSSELRQTEDQLNVIHDIMNAGQNQYINSKGFPILNPTQGQIWFSRNVAFVFALGRIYDKEDDAKMAAIMSYFNDNNENAYLDNHIRIDSFNSSPLIQEIERKLRIGNGNYHVFMVPLVYADEKDLQYAPEPQFKRKGIVDKYVSWDSIITFMKEMIVRYGLITRVDRTPTTTSHEIGSTDLPEEPYEIKPSSRYDEQTKFNYNGLNENIEVMSTIDDTLRIKEELNAVHDPRNRQGKMDRKGDSTGHFNNAPRKSLYSQMYGDMSRNMKYDTIPGTMKGVTLRLDDNALPTGTVVDEYQLYDDAYDAEHNKNAMHDVLDSRQSIPRLQLFATRATSNGNRQVNINIDSLGIKTTNQFDANHQGYNTV